MHAALFANRQWLEEEMATFHHLVVGLIDEQVRVAQVLPAGVPEQEISPFGERIGWEEASLGCLRRLRLLNLADPLTEAGVDLLHALDGELWDGIARLARRMQRPAVFSVNAETDLARIPRVKRLVGGLPHGFTAPTEPLHEALADRLGGATPTALVRPGVRVPETAGQKPFGTPPFCLVVTGTGKLDAHYQALIEALKVLIARADQPIQFFLVGSEGEQHELWKLGKRSGLLPHMSLVPRGLGHHELYMGADALIQPQPMGRARRLLLEAMVHSLPVIACRDPWLDWLEANQTAWLVDPPDPPHWTQALEYLVSHPEESRTLGDSARRFVAERHVPAQAIAATLGLYRRVTGESIPFPGHPVREAPHVDR